MVAGFIAAALLMAMQKGSYPETCLIDIIKMGVCAAGSASLNNYIFDARKKE